MKSGFLGGSDKVPHLWHTQIPPAITRHLVSWYKPHGNCNMGKFELTMGGIHIALLTIHMTPLKHSHNGCNSITETSSKNRQSNTRSEVSGALLY